MPYATVSNKPFLAENPRIPSLRMILILCMLLFGAILVMLGIFPFAWSTIFTKQQPSYYRWILVGAALFVLFFIYRIYIYFLALKHIERSRVPIAVEKRYSPAVADGLDSHSLFVPISPIIFKFRRKFIYPFTLTVLIFTILLTAQLVLIPAGTSSYPSFFSLGFAALFILIFEITPYIIILALLLKVRKTIQVTDHALSSGSRKTVLWQEAYFFARYELPDLFPGRKTTHYELSSSTQMITWISLPDPLPSFSIWKPELSMGEYQHQMRELCDLITAKTGLALHDLTQTRERN